jgi:hypothetical protein
MGADILITGHTHEFKVGVKGVHCAGGFPRHVTAQAVHAGHKGVHTHTSWKHVCDGSGLGWQSAVATKRRWPSCSGGRALDSSQGTRRSSRLVNSSALPLRFLHAF